MSGSGGFADGVNSGGSGAAPVGGDGTIGETPGDGGDGGEDAAIRDSLQRAVLEFGIQEVGKYARWANAIAQGLLQKIKRDSKPEEERDPHEPDPFMKAIMRGPR